MLEVYKGKEKIQKSFWRGKKQAYYRCLIIRLTSVIQDKRAESFKSSSARKQLSWDLTF